MRKLLIFNLILMLNISVLFLISCSDGRIYSSGVSTDDKSSFQIPNITDVRASIKSSTDSHWFIKESNFSNKSNLVELDFYDDRQGWIIDEYRRLLTTSNAGMTWIEKANFQGISKNFSISHAHFSNSLNGFVVTNKSSKSANESDTSKILMTGDGGKFWKAVFDGQFETISQINFTNEYEGWAVGRKSSFDSYYHRNYLVLHTVDKGETWIDVSQKLNETAITEKDSVNDELTALISKETNETTVLSLRGKIFQTKDGGNSWHLISVLPSEPMQTRIRHLGQLETGEIWVAGGTISKEGKWGMVAVLNNRLNWDRFRLDGYYFSDIEFLSNTKVIACGSIVAADNFGESNEQNKGVILYSTDSGKNWIVVHESKLTNQFNSIARLSEQKIYVVGNNGVRVVLENP